MKQDITKDFFDVLSAPPEKIKMRKQFNKALAKCSKQDLMFAIAAVFDLSLSRHWLESEALIDLIERKQ